VEDWIRRMTPEETDEQALVRVLGACATVERLTLDSTALARLALSGNVVHRGLARWLEEDAPDATAREFDVRSAKYTPTWAAHVEHHVEAAQGAFDYQRLGAWLKILAPEVVRLQEQVDQLLVQVDDVDNAQRVLGRAAAEITRVEREQLRRSTDMEVQRAREAERMQLARVFSESVTAVERIMEAGGPTTLADLSRRLRELASNANFVVVGRVGEEVPIDPAVHESNGTPGESGNVRRVGVVDGQGNPLIRPAVVPLRRSV